MATISFRILKIINTSSTMLSLLFFFLNPHYSYIQEHLTPSISICFHASAWSINLAKKIVEITSSPIPGNNNNNNYNKKISLIIKLYHANNKIIRKIIETDVRVLILDDMKIIIGNNNEILGYKICLCLYNWLFMTV